MCQEVCGRRVRRYDLDINFRSKLERRKTLTERLNVCGLTVLAVPPSESAFIGQLVQIVVVENKAIDLNRFG